MATSLQTANYGFGKYAPDDVTSYLTDYNGTMDKIDSAIKDVSDVANEAKATSDSNLNNIANLSQGLTATNKNVENLAKAQTAQGVEIENLKSDFSSLTIGEMKAFHPECVGSGTGNMTGRNIGGYFYGDVSLQMNEGTRPMDKSINGVSYCTLAHVPGNPWNLTEDLTDKCVSCGLILGGAADLKKNVPDIIVFYDKVTNTTRIAVASSSFVVSSAEKGQLHVHF